MEIKEVLNKYFPEPTKMHFELFGNGATNATYKISVEEGNSKKWYILQKMNIFFDPSVVSNISAVTEHLISKKFTTQEVVKTIGGELFVRDGESWWRMLTFVSGQSFISISSSDKAKEAGALAGEFHTALLDCTHEFAYKIPHFHETDFIMNNLDSVLLANQNTEKYSELKDITDRVLVSYEKLPKKSNLPERIIHGDLKISNVLFDKDGKEAVALVDLDTLMRGSIAVEMGDALRSWCMKGGEDVEVVKFDKEVYDKALAGYFSKATFLSEEEKNSIPYGMMLITLELCARFIIDAFEEKYFVLNSQKYKNIFEQNKKRAENQLAFFEEFSKVF